MNIKGDQQLKDAYELLPQVLKDVVDNSDIQAKLRKLSEVHKLHLDKWTILEEEIMKGILGVTHIDELAENISREVGIPMAQALEISDAVIEIVLDPIQGELRDELGDNLDTVERIDAESGSKAPIDISKFSGAPVDPAVYKPTTKQSSLADHDPYHEPIE